jgi:tetratricopeptide (TPR) repeat protein
VDDGRHVLDLSRVLLAEEIACIRAEGWSGVLALQQGEVAKGLYFVGGQIAFAASTVEEDRLGANLFRIGKITEAQFRAAMKRAEELGHPLGRALLDAGILSPFELRAAVAGQVERIVLSVLRWTNGRMQRETMDRPLPADLTLDLDTNRLLLLGLRQFSDAERLERALGGPERRLQRVLPAPFDYEREAVLPAERAVLALCTRAAPVGEVLALPHPRPQLARAAYALLAGGLLEEAPAAPVMAAASAPPPSPVAPSPAPLLPATEPPDLPKAPPPLPQRPEEAERTARDLLEKGFRQRAAEVLAAALERHPAVRPLRRLLAMTLAREEGFRPEVERHFITALEAEPGDTELRYALASYYRRAGMAARAILQLRVVLSRDPGHAAAWRDLGELEAREARRGH